MQQEMHRFYLVMLVMLASSLGCATGYKPKGITGGYYEYPAGGGNKYIVGFSGNGYTSPSAASQMAHRRAEELCDSLGFDDYDVIDRSVSSQQQVINGTSNCYGRSGQSGFSATCYQSGGGIINRPTSEIFIACKKNVN